MKADKGRPSRARHSETPCISLRGFQTMETAYENLRFRSKNSMQLTWSTIEVSISSNHECTTKGYPTWQLLIFKTVPESQFSFDVC